MSVLTDTERGELYYDLADGEYCRLDDTASRVLLLKPETSDIYHEMSEEEWEEDRGDFIRVENMSAEDPIRYVEENVMPRNTNERYALNKVLEMARE